MSPPQKDSIDLHERHLTPALHFVWLVLTRFGMATALVIGAALAGAWWLYYVSAPEARARVTLLEATVKNGDRVNECLAKIIANEEGQIRWQMEWKAYIEAQHRQRAEESKAIIDHQTKARLFYQTHQETADKFFERTDKIHSDQVELLKELISIAEQVSEQLGAKPKKDPAIPKPMD